MCIDVTRCVPHPHAACHALDSPLQDAGDLHAADMTQLQGLYQSILAQGNSWSPPGWGDSPLAGAAHKSMPRAGREYVEPRLLQFADDSITAAQCVSTVTGQGGGPDACLLVSGTPRTNPPASLTPFTVQAGAVGPGQPSGELPDIGEIIQNYQRHLGLQPCPPASRELAQEPCPAGFSLFGPSSGYQGQQLASIFCPPGAGDGLAASRSPSGHQMTFDPSLAAMGRQVWTLMRRWGIWV